MCCLQPENVLEQKPHKTRAFTSTHSVGEFLMNDVTFFVFVAVVYVALWLWHTNTSVDKNE